MVYECENCAAALPPGVKACPQCGEAFDESVPLDAEVPRKGWKTRGDTPSVVVPPTVAAPPPIPEPAPIPQVNFAPPPPETQADEPNAEPPPVQPKRETNLFKFLINRQREQIAAKQKQSYKPQWYDYVMLWLTGFAVVASADFRVLCFFFYCLLALAYIGEWAIRYYKRVAGAGRRAS